MSLLLDALKRAEQAKLAKYTEAPKGAPAEIALSQSTMAIASPDLAKPSGPTTPVSPASFTTHAAPPLTQRGLELSLQDVEPPRSTGAAALAVDAQAQRDAVKNAFAAKQIASSGRPKWIFGIAAAALIVVLIGAWYVWNETSRVGKAVPQAATGIGPIAIPGRPSLITKSPNETPRPMSPAPIQPQPPASEVAAPTGTRPPAPEGKAEVVLPTQVAGVNLRSARNSRDVLMKDLIESPPAKDSSIELRHSRVIEPPRVSPELSSAYDALKAGDYANARKLYADVIRFEPLNLDGHLGMASALGRSGDASGAARAYRMALEVDPRNGVALAGLISVSSVSDSFNQGALEMDLKNLLAKDPNSAALAFSLGNLYASQSRWNEAQQVYFDAFRLEPENADYVYNLAVSLDQLKQPRLALDYYQRAIATAPKAGAQFDPAQVTRRVNELKLAN